MTWFYNEESGQTLEVEEGSVWEQEARLRGYEEIPAPKGAKSAKPKPEEPKQPEPKDDEPQGDEQPTGEPKTDDEPKADDKSGDKGGKEKK